MGHRHEPRGERDRRADGDQRVHRRRAVQQAAEAAGQGRAAPEEKHRRRQNDHTRVENEFGWPHHPKDHLGEHPGDDRYGERPRPGHAALRRLDLALILGQTLTLALEPPLRPGAFHRRDTVTCRLDGLTKILHADSVGE